jgi:hypothetical protein
MLHHHTKVSHVHSLSVSTMSLLSLGLAGKVAVVTGAAQGIGAAVARALAALGMKVAILDLESQRELAAGVSVCPCPMVCMQSRQPRHSNGQTVDVFAVHSLQRLRWWRQDGANLSSRFRVGSGDDDACTSRFFVLALHDQ